MGVAWLVDGTHVATVGSDHCATMRESICESEANTEESRQKDSEREERKTLLEPLDPAIPEAKAPQLFN